MRHPQFLWLLSLGIAFTAIGCSSPAKMSTADRSTLSAEADAAMVAFKNEDPTLAGLMSKAEGYAVFPDVGKAGFIAGGSHGDGVVYDNTGKIGYADITQATVGLQAGAQTFSELVLFLKQEDLSKFKNNQFQIAANLSAVAIKSGAAGSA